MDAVKKVLITGTNGNIGGMLMNKFRESGKYEVIATARNADPERNILAMNLLDRERILELTKGVDVIVHMAAYMVPGRLFEEQVIPNNIVGTYYIYDAMRANNVGRMVYGSSNHTIGYYRSDDQITGDSPTKPDTYYGVSKVACEALGSVYSSKYDISCINIRIGHFPRHGKPISPYRTKTWISPRDMAHLVGCCIDAPPEIKFLNVFGISKNTDRPWPIDHLKDLIGYDPQDDGADYMEEAKNFEWYQDGKGGYKDETGYMGGDFVNIDLE